MEIKLLFQDSFSANQLIIVLKVFRNISRP